MNSTSFMRSPDIRPLSLSLCPKGDLLIQVSCTFDKWNYLYVCIRESQIITEDKKKIISNKIKFAENRYKDTINFDTQEKTTQTF